VIEKFVPALISTEDQEKCIFTGQDPIRVGKRSVPTTISTYTSHLKAFSLDLDDETRSSLSFPPSRRLRGQRSYVEVTKTTTSSATQPIELTNLTNSTTSETASLGSSFTDFEAKLKIAMNKLMALKDKIDTNQTKLNEQYDTLVSL
jgi:hypothetical protein